VVAQNVLRVLLRDANESDTDVDDGGQFSVVRISPPTAQDLRMRGLSTKIMRYLKQHIIDSAVLLVRRRSMSVASVALGHFCDNLGKSRSCEYQSREPSSGKVRMTWTVIKNDESSCCLRQRHVIDT
jgi:hypothetical protein